MNTQMMHIKIKGHGCKKGRTWNVAHLLPRKKRLALQSLNHRNGHSDDPHSPNPSLDHRLEQPEAEADLARRSRAPLHQIRNPQSSENPAHACMSGGAICNPAKGGET